MRAAEANLHAASAQVGVAAAARLPNFTLSASAGALALTPAGLFAPGTEFWTLGWRQRRSLDGGYFLAAQVRKAARASFDQSKAQYRSTVLAAAFQNVADALSRPSIRTPAGR